ncbi:MAG TPA: ATP-binding protein [Minicystis sp.]|nr:ATP-binding protein [Minicystis sp.]
MTWAAVRGADDAALLAGSASLSDATPAGLYALAPGGEVVACNEAYAALVGLASARAALGTTPLPPLAGGSGELELTIEGKRRVLLRVERPVEGGGVRGAAVDGTDVRAARQLAERGAAFDATGRALGAVGHELNNLLAIVLNYATMIASELPPAHPLLEDIGEVQRAALRAVALARKLLVVGSREPARPSAADAGVVAADVVASLAAVEGVAVVPRIAGPAPCSVDGPQLEGVLRALVDNACEAMPDGGTLEIAVDVAELAEHEIPGVAAGAWTRVVVRDTGRGMDERQLARAVEPFFSTKPNPKGIGVGLSAAYARARRAGGHLLIDSAPGAGTAVTVLLPVPPRA